MKLYTLVFPLILAFPFSLDFCLPSPKGPPQPKPGDVVHQVQVVMPQFVEKPRQVTGSGFFSASERVTTKAPMAVKLERIYVGEGDRVSEGDPLCLFRSEELEAQLEEKQAALKEAEAALEYYQNRIDLPGTELGDDPNSDTLAVFLDEDLPQDKPVPERPRGQIDPPTPEPAAAPAKPSVEGKIRFHEAQIERLNKELDGLEEKIKNLTVKAPIGGVIEKRHISEGATLENKNPLFDIVNLNPVTLTFHVTQEVSSYVDKLIKVKASPLDAPEIELEGNVFFISPAIDPIDKTLEIRAHFANPQGLIKEGQRGNATLKTRKIDKVLQVPRQALISHQSRHFMYVIVGKQSRLTEVSLIREQDNGMTLIDANIRIDDPIIINGYEKLEDGSFVAITKPKAPSAPNN